MLTDIIGSLVRFYIFLFHSDFDGQKCIIYYNALHVIGRVDDVINPSGHRIGTAEVESALVACPQVPRNMVNCGYNAVHIFCIYRR